MNDTDYRIALSNIKHLNSNKTEHPDKLEKN